MSAADGWQRTWPVSQLKLRALAVQQVAAAAAVSAESDSEPMSDDGLRCWGWHTYDASDLSEMAMAVTMARVATMALTLALTLARAVVRAVAVAVAVATRGRRALSGSARSTRRR